MRGGSAAADMRERHHPGVGRRVVEMRPYRRRARPRVVWGFVGATTLIVLLCAVGVSVGEMTIPLGDVAAVLFGGGTGGDRFIVGELRLPRVLVALGAGLALGISGALVQNITRNPLASPDVIGILSGASTGAVAAIVLGASASASPIVAWGVSPFAILGGMIAAAVVFLLSWRREASGVRLVLVGIGVATICAALTSLLLVRARIHEAAQAVVWLTGTLDGRTWTHVWPLVVGLLVVSPVLLTSVRPLGPLSLGDTLARSLGVRTGVVRIVLLASATVLASVAVAAAGPIGFVAFVAPQTMMRIIGSPTPPVLGGGLAGAVLLLATDAVTRTLLPIGLPVGIVTVVLGAPCFVLLIVARRRRSTI